MYPLFLKRSVALAAVLLCAAPLAHADTPRSPETSNASSAPPSSISTQDEDPYAYTIDDDPWPQLLALADRSLNAHPALQSRRSEAIVAERMVDGVGIRPDASLSLAAMALPWKPPSLNADPMSAIELGVSVPLWYPKELRAQKTAAKTQATALESTVNTARTELLIEAADIYYDIYAIDRAIAALEHIKPLLAQHIELLKRRIPTGHASVVQVERMRLNLMRIDDQIRTHMDARPAKVARLNVVLNRDPQESVPSMAGVARSVQIDTVQTDTVQERGAQDYSEQQHTAQTQSTDVEITPRNPLTQLDMLVQNGMAQRPFLESLERQKESAFADADAAAWAKKPQLTVFGSWMFRAKPKSPSPMMDDGMDMFSIGIRSTLPFASRHRANAARDVAEARSVALDATAAAFEQQLRGDLSARLMELHRVVEHAAFYKDELIPQAKRVRAAAMAGLNADRADYEAWIDAEQQLAEIEVSFAQLEANVLKHHAMISMLTGLPAGAPKTPSSTQIHGGDTP